ncbi:MAG: hypothetical protein QCH96_07910, partial [Candidatus Thermoplasmatota archaeon]|nr:hypothetical protein [Candidatus Thermoplasmatota archaeon]
MIEFFLILLFCFLGVLTGILTGILPGLHVNNIALIFLSLTTTILAVLHPLINYGITADFILVLIALYIISVSI